MHTASPVKITMVYQPKWSMVKRVIKLFKEIIKWMNADVADAHLGISSQCSNTGTITNPAPIPKKPDKNPAPNPPA